MTRDQQSLVRDLLDQDVGSLDDWSINFLESLEDKYWQLTQPITQKQIDKLHELAKKEGLIE